MFFFLVIDKCIRYASQVDNFAFVHVLFFLVVDKCKICATYSVFLEQILVGYVLQNFVCPF